MTNTLAIQWERLNGSGKARVTALRGDAMIVMDEIHLGRHKERLAFLQTVMKAAPDADAIDLDAKLMAAAHEATQTPEPQEPAEPVDESAEMLLRAMPESVRIAAAEMLECPDLLARILRDVEALGVAGERELVATVYMVGVSRHLSKPLALIVQGPSASGKSHTIETVAGLFPAEAVVYATQMTPQALFHMKPGSLRHRFVVAGERSRLENDEKAEATRGLREMLSGGKLTKLMPTKVNGTITTVPINQEGPIAFVESTTLGNIFAEDANRCILANTDERPAQTATVLRHIARSAAGGNTEAMKQSIITKHNALQRLLQPRPVVVPFADSLGELLPHDRVETRRAFPQILAMIQASALLHQRQRKVDAEGRLIADANDYGLARQLLSHPMARSLGRGISAPAQRFHEKLTQWFSTDEVFTRPEAANRETSSPSSVYSWIGELHTAGMLELVEAGRGRAPSRWRIIPNIAPDSGGLMPSVEKVTGASR